MVGPLFVPSIEPLKSATFLNSHEQENIHYELLDIPIAEGGGGGCGGGGGAGGSGEGGGGVKSKQQQENSEKNKEKAKEAAKKRNEKKLMNEIVNDRRKFIEAERKDPRITYSEKIKDKVSYLIKKTAASNPSPNDNLFEFYDKKYARLKELELIASFIDIAYYESIYSLRDFSKYSNDNKKLPRKLQLRKEIFEKQLSLVSKINREAYSKEIRKILYHLVEKSGSLTKIKMRIAGADDD